MVRTLHIWPAMKLRCLKTLFVTALLMGSRSGARAQDSTLIPSNSYPVPECRLMKSTTEYVLYAGNQEIKRVLYSYGPNIKDDRGLFNNALEYALKTLKLMRETGVCQ